MITIFLMSPQNLLGSPVGYASLNGGTSGGGTGPVVTATSGAQFKAFAEQDGPLNIRVDGTLNVGQVRVASDKTISGIGATGQLVGSLRINDVNNVIVRNLSISNPGDAGEGDAITLRGSQNIWIDHNDIFDAPDGLLDIVRASDFVTVSWNKLYYTSAYAAGQNTNHRFAMLIGNSDNAPEDIGKLRVTLHHNHFGDRVIERMPRGRYGDIHVFNNYFNSPGNNYAVRAAVGSELLIENNHFENIRDPFQKFTNDAGIGQIEARGNLFVNSTDPSDPGLDDVFDPPYSYNLADVSTVESSVLAAAGSAALPGDYNADGVVSAADYPSWRNHRGESAGPLPNNSDGAVIDTNQYDTWKANFGMTLPTTGAAKYRSVPEPATWKILGGVIAIAGTLSSRKTRPVRDGSSVFQPLQAAVSPHRPSYSTRESCPDRRYSRGLIPDHC